MSHLILTVGREEIIKCVQVKTRREMCVKSGGSDIALRESGLRWNEWPRRKASQQFKGVLFAGGVARQPTRTGGATRPCLTSWRTGGAAFSPQIHAGRSEGIRNRTMPTRFLTLTGCHRGSRHKAFTFLFARRCPDNSADAVQHAARPLPSHAPEPAEVSFVDRNKSKG